MKKTKLKLEDLKVQSFVTSMEKQEKQTVDGGEPISEPYMCNNGPNFLTNALQECVEYNPAPWCTEGGDGYKGCKYLMYC